MNCGPDFVKSMQVLWVFLLSAGLLCLFWKADEELHQYAPNRIVRCWFCYSSIITAGVLLIPAHDEKGEIKCLILLAIYLVVCTVTDVLMCQVYDGMQYLGVLGGCIWALMNETQNGIGFSLIMFVGMQYFILMKKYGKADGMGYCICALFLAGKNIDIEGYLYHMVISFSLLAVVQLLGNNVTRKGDLKRPVALYPYISIGFMVMWIFLS